MKLLSRLWADEAGFVVSSELVLIATVMVVGLLAGMTTVRDQVMQELADVADAVSEIDQSYAYTSITGHTSSTAGSWFDDTGDDCDFDDGNNNNGNGSSAQCISIHVAADVEGGGTQG
jgi:Flp pilus assembly pilin Flp